MRSLCALMVSLVVWNVLALPGRAEGDRAGGLQAGNTAELVRRRPASDMTLLVHGRLEAFGTNDPDRLILAYIQAGNQRFFLSLVNADLKKKAEGLHERQVIITGYLKNKELLVQSLSENKDANPKESATVSLRGKVTVHEATLPDFTGISMTVEGETFWLDLSGNAELKPKLDKLKGDVVVSGSLELRTLVEFSGKTAWLVKVTSIMPNLIA